jgi:hypothetical protein
MIHFDPYHPDYSLRVLVHDFERNPKPFDQIPKRFLDYYGIGILANSLTLISPTVPKFDSKKVSDVMERHAVKTLDMLIQLISTLDSDIEKLYAIYYYGCHHVQYDVDSYFNNKVQSTTLEKVFTTGKAVCEGYALFLREMAKRVGIRSIEIHEFDNLAKGYSWNQLNPPRTPKSDHASDVVIINGNVFLSEPCWGAGYLNDQRRFQPEYREELFLRPIVCTINDHFPVGESAKFVDFLFTYETFIKTPEYKGVDFKLHAESHPFSRFECTTGNLQMQFSCQNCLSSILIRVYHLKGNTFYEQNDIYTGSRIVQSPIPAAPDRCRFLAFIAFPKIGLFKIKMYLNTHSAYEAYVDSRQIFSQIPFLNSVDPKIKFIPILPKGKLSVAKNGVAFVRFAVAKDYANFFVDVYQLLDDSFNNLKGCRREIVQQATMLIPFDNKRVENVFTITFPENGKFLVKIWINDIGSNSSSNCILLVYHVYGAINQYSEVPFKFLYRGRNFLPLSNEQITVQPSDSVIMANSNAFKLTATIPKGTRLLLNLRSLENDSGLENCSEVGRTEVNGKVAIQYSLRMSHYGTFRLLFFLNQTYLFEQIYYYQSNNLPEPTKEELQLQEELKKEICEPYDELWDIRQSCPEYFPNSTTKKRAEKIEPSSTIKSTLSIKPIMKKKSTPEKELISIMESERELKSNPEQYFNYSAQSAPELESTLKLEFNSNMESETKMKSNPNKESSQQKESEPKKKSNPNQEPKPKKKSQPKKEESGGDHPYDYVENDKKDRQKSSCCLLL